MILGGLGRFFGWSKSDLEELSLDEMLHWNSVAHAVSQMTPGS